MKTTQDPLKNLIIEIEQIKNAWEFEKAYKIIQEAIIKHEDDYRLYEELADTAIYIGNIKKAKEAVDYALKLNPESATWNYLKGFLCLNDEQYEKALKYLEKSNKMFWNNPEVLRNLGWAYVMNNQTERWIIILKRALNLAPWDKLITEDLAMALIWKWEIIKWNELLKSIWKYDKIKNNPLK